MKKLITACMAALFLCLAAVPASAASVATVQRIYGSETLAIDCKGFSDFYKGDMFVFFNVDFDVPYTGATLQNRQLLGDMTLKPAVNNQIKLGGQTVKQLCANNAYAAMIAFEATGEGKLRMCVWMSWGDENIQSLFAKEVKTKFSFEITDKLVVPDTGYEHNNGKLIKVKPAKYEISITDLEFKQDKKNAEYTADKDGWVKPMFEELKATWKLVGDTPVQTSTAAPVNTTANTTANTPAQTTAAPGPGADTTAPPDASDATEPADTGDSQPETGDTTQTTADSSTTRADAGTTTSGTAAPADSPSGFPVLPVVLIAVGVVVIGGGAAFFIVTGLKKKQPPVE